MDAWSYCVIGRRRALRRLVGPADAGLRLHALRTERDELASNIAVLNQRGARADVRRCGTGHLCVRVDLKAPRYGESSDYLLLKRY